MKELFPYKTLFGDVATVVSAVSVDGEPLPRSRVDATRREVDLGELERAGWTSAAVSLDVSPPPTEISELNASGAVPQVVVVAQCGPTNSRQAVTLKQIDGEPRWSGRLELDRTSWFGRIEIRTAVTATVSGVPTRLIGEGNTWSVLLDDLPRPPINGALMIRWENFDDPADNNLRVLKLYKNDAFFLHLDPDAPILYLNSAFEGLFSLLQDRRRRPAGEQALHDETRGAIATEVWLGLFNAALQSIEHEDGVPRWPASEWQKTVLELVFERMYPEKAADDSLEEVATALMEPDGASAVQQLALPAVAAHAGASRLLRDAIRRIGGEATTEEART
jgi:hypothetical protein